MADSDRTWNGLVSMDDADVEMEENEPDPRGWDVISADGRKIGEVDGMFVDTGAMKVRYLEVPVDNDELDLGDDTERRLMIPVRSVQLDEEDEKVMVPNLESSRIAGYRGLVDLGRESFGTATARDQATTGDRGERGGAGDAGDRLMADVDRARDADRDRIASRRDLEAGRAELDSERDLDAEHGDAGSGLHTDLAAKVRELEHGGSGEVRIPRVEEELDVGKETVRAGEVDVHKRVETEHVSEPVRLRREEVDVERRPVEGDASLQGREVDMGDTDIRVPVREERAVARKRPVVREELVLRKRTVTDTDNVDADVRKERIDVDRSGDRARGDTDEASDR